MLRAEQERSIVLSFQHMEDWVKTAMLHSMGLLGEVKSAEDLRQVLPRASDEQVALLFQEIKDNGDLIEAIA